MAMSPRRAPRAGGATRSTPSSTSTSPCCSTAGSARGADVLVFIHINKTAGRTMRYILRSSYGPRHCEAEPWAGRHGGPFSAADLRRVRRIYPDLASIAGHAVTGYADLDADEADLRYFAFLRDPLK